MWRDVRSQKLRTFLTVFGIVWGTVSVSLLLAFGKGLQRQMIVNSAGLGDAICIAWPGLTSIPFEGLGKGRKIRLNEDDVEAIRRETQGINADLERVLEDAEAELRRQDDRDRHLRRLARVRRDAQPQSRSAGGRFFNPIGHGRAAPRPLHRQQDGRRHLRRRASTPVGKTVMLGGSPFLVVGVLQSKVQNSSYSGRDNQKGFIPGTTYRAITGEKWVDNLIYQPTVAANAEQITDDVRRVIAQRQRFDPDDKEAFSVWDTTENFKFFATSSSSRSGSFSGSSAPSRSSSAASACRTS